MVKMFRRLSDARIIGTRVLLRVDCNVPIERGNVMSDFRIRAHLPTIRLLRRNRNRVVILAHHSDPRRSLRPVAARLAELLGEPVRFVADPASAGRLARRGGSPLIFVENLRKWPGEVHEARAFSAALASLGDVFVNDAFAVSHRRAASLTVLPRLLPSFLGPRFARELAVLSDALRRPRRPLVAIFGGVKVGTKVALLRRFIRHADLILVGSVLMSGVFGIGKPPAALRLSADVRRRLLRSGKLVHPVDIAVHVRGRIRLKAPHDVAKREPVYDVGPKTIRLYRDALRKARTIIWNGPLGLIEEPQYARGTRMIAAAVARSHATTIVGGGETVAFIERLGLAHRFTYLSTGGGAMLAFLAGDKLPALEALKRGRKGCNPDAKGSGLRPKRRRSRKGEHRLCRNSHQRNS